MTVAGLSATQFDMMVQANPSESGGTNLQADVIAISAIAQFVDHPGDDSHTNTPEAHLRFIVLRVRMRTLLIYIEAPEAEFAGFVAVAN